MSSERQFARDAVLPSYWRLHEALIPACVKCGAGGSLRRRVPYVNDLEMIVLPYYDTQDTLFEAGETGETYSQLDAALEKLLREGVLVWDEETVRRGQKYKRFILPALGLPVDLFIAQADNYGFIQALRTGCGDFSHALVTPRHQGGLRPASLRCKDGYVWRQKPVRGTELAMTEAFPMPSEEALFEAWGMPYVPACDRNAGIVADLRRAFGLVPVPSFTNASHQQQGAN